MSASVSSRGHRWPPPDPDAPAPPAPTSAGTSSSCRPAAVATLEPPAGNSSKLPLVAPAAAGCSSIGGGGMMMAETDAGPVGVGENGSVPAVVRAMYGDPAPPWWCSMAAATSQGLGNRKLRHHLTSAATTQRCLSRLRATSTCYQLPLV
ncbi:hypothetical protein C2845_PM11G10870 [Panicum miliaceum]|uniref:Uncharacterized protein n=1 Tax=Panicum miliaceum TaxID=4540 RepID=A0A3L6RS44_PANMI|nr:hypothetical protein C2845_PM11G10870 [Panicum miliaceum]